MQMELIAADGEPLGDFMRVTMPREPTPLGDPIVARRTTAPGQRYVRTADAATPTLSRVPMSTLARSGSK